jgi:type IV pilus assembly protein PilW
MNTKHTAQRRQHGLTLVEIMVALTISAVLVAGILQVFSGNRQTYRLQEGMARLQENARFALEFMAQDIRQAGYRGCIRNLSGVNNGLNNPSPSFSPATGIQGWEFTGGGSGTAPGDTYDLNATDAAPVTTNGNDAGWSGWAPDSGNALQVSGSSDGPTVMRGSDILRIWHGGTATLEVNSITPGNTGGQATIINVEQSNAIQGNDIILVSDCEAADWLQVCSTATGPTVDGQPTTDLIASSACAPGNDPNKPPASFAANGEVMQLQAGTYFVGKKGGDAQNPPALYYATLASDGTMEGPQELIEGVDSMQILYGEDTDLDGNVDSYRTADAVTDWNNIINVKLSLLLRTVEEVDTRTHGGNYEVNGTTINLVANDRRPRRVVTTTIALRNRTG